MADLGLTNKVAVITGASGGWGRAVARQLAANGAKVVVNGTTPERVEEVEHAIRSAGGQAVGVPAPVDTADGARHVVDTAVETFGSVDILVNSTGRKRPATILEMTEQQWDEVINVQLRAVFLCTALAARQMVRQATGGRIVVMAGGTASKPLPTNANHAASKGGALAAVYTWAQELAPYAITVNAARGAVMSAGTQDIVERMQAESTRDAGGVRSPRELGFFPAEDAAPLVVWLASDLAGGVTGAFFGIDGPTISVWEPGRPTRWVTHTSPWTPDAIADHVKAVVESHPAQPRDALQTVLRPAPLAGDHAPAR